ncbi:hypothetical protein ACG1VR_05080 [Cedecea davisae]|uniref:hypothetical protein n=1 Tax=Cedecea davisae TaxID=158484 RepID=UPI00376EEB70
MSDNWSRHFELQLLKEDGSGIALSNFKVTFKVEWHTGSSPKTAEVKIYNLAPDSVNRIAQKEFTKIRLIAGYNGLEPIVNSSEVGKVRIVDPAEWGARDGMNFGVIFSGDIRIWMTGRETSVDDWLLIQAMDGHEALTSAVLSATLAKGYTVKDMYQLAAGALKPFGIFPGRLPPLPETKFPRGYTFHGKVSSYLDQIGELCKASWKLSNDRLDYYSNTEKAHPPINLNSQNGLIGRPQTSTNAGVTLKCLINPNILLNGQVKLDQNTLYKPALVENDKYTHPSPDGIYDVYGIAYSGDTRAQNWYMTMMCFPAGQPVEKVDEKWTKSPASQEKV